MLSRFASNRTAAAPYRSLDPTGLRSDFLAALKTTHAALVPLGERNALLSLTPPELEQLRKTIASIGADARALGLQKLALRAYAFEFRIDDYQGPKTRAHQSFEFRESFRYLMDVIGQTLAEQPNMNGVPHMARRVVLASGNSLDHSYAAEALGTAVKLTLTQSAADLFEHLSHHSTDLVLLGDRLPDLTVLEILDQLKETPAMAALPVLVLAQDGATETSVGALVHGATDVVPCGLRPSEAGQRILDALTSGRQRLHRN